MKTYLISFGSQCHVFRTCAQPGTFSFWFDVHSFFSAPFDSFEWVEI